ncbi:FxsA family protein [Salinicola endophyticus]|uniref:FxsA family protein n=1 Tax=Salinicola endophyticus TaxID=1949083 RepID=UPI000DA11830|nr:FxsA family protein [Salinicola endophyticus]
MPLLFLLALFLLADFIVLFTLGAKLGLLLTLLWIALSAAFGLHLIRRESLLTLQRARERLALGELPSDELLAGATFVLAGVLLMAPGFLSDLLGLVCLLPGSGQLARRWFPRAASGGGRTQGQGGSEWGPAASTAHRDSAPRDGSESRPLEGDFIGRDSSGRDGDSR